jgi:endonuclease/exonuclease/phosphatase (EEP) superfamily protein YafD
MSVFRILFIAAGLQLVGLALVLAIGGFFGFRGEHLDMINSFSPIWVGLALVGGLIAWFGLGRRRARIASTAAAVLAVLLAGAPIMGEYAAGLRQAMSAPRDVARPLKVLTINASAESYSPAVTSAVIVRTGADVVLVQEPVQLLMASAVLDRAYPYRLDCPPDNLCQLAIWSKRPFVQTGVIARRPGRAGWNDLDLVWARLIAPDGRPATFATTHYRWQIEWAQRVQRRLLVDYASKLQSDDLVLAGDFNLTPWSYALRRQDRKLAPLTRRTRAVYSWPAFVPRIFFPLAAPILPIDHLYAGRGWKTVKVERVGPAASDHYGVLVTLARAPAGKR